MPIPLKTISSSIRKFAEIQKAVPAVGIEIEPENFWVSSTLEWHFKPKFSGINDVSTLALICETMNWYIPYQSLSAETQNLPLFNQARTSALVFEHVQKSHTSFLQSPIKYHYDTCKHFAAAGFGLTVPMLITGQPTESNTGGKGYRLLHGTGLITCGDGFARDVNSHGTISYAVSTDSPLYNYIDRGHIVFFSSKTGEDPNIFIANQLSLNVYYFAALFAIIPDRVRHLLRNEVFLPAQVPAELQRILLLAERELPERYAQAYNHLKQTIRTDFEANAQNVIVTKFQRREIKDVTLNNIKLSATRASYETISIESEGLADVVLRKLDPNGVFDIYQLVDAYIAAILEEANSVPLNSTGQGFQEARTWAFRINNIPITLSLSTTNTRRRVNGKLINSDELPRVIRRATCYTDETQYNSFLRQIEKASLRVHDAVGNGVPIKIWVPDRRGYRAEVTMKYPKIFFMVENGKYYLWLNKERTERVALRRFVGMLDELKRLNSRTDNGWASDDSGLNYRNIDWCKWKLKKIIREHAVNDKNEPLVTAEQLNPLIEWLLEARTEAEKKSAELLASVVKETKAKEIVHNGNPAYEIVGNSGMTYAVEREGTFKVWRAKTNEYVCIVDGRGEMGVGYDALVARLLALKNDTFVVDKIGTLRDPIAAARAEATAPASA